MTGLLQGRSLRLIAGAIVVLNGFFPALWILFTSLKREAELVHKPITYWPHAPTLNNYIQAFSDQPLLMRVPVDQTMPAVSRATSGSTMSAPRIEVRHSAGNALTPQ